MSMGWAKVPLSDLTEKDRSITYGVVKPGDEVEGGVAFIRGGDVSQGRIAVDALRTISPQLSQIYKRTLLQGGELLVSLVGNPGEVAIAPPSLAGANIARQVGLVALRREIDTQFVMYFLMSPLGRAELFARTGGAVQQVINLADLKTIHVPVPSTSMQRRISDILSTYDDLIENNRRRMALLEESARLLYREWFVRLRFPGYEHTPIVDGVPQGWERKSLGDLCSEIRDMVLPEALEPDTPYIGLEHIPRRSISLNEWGTVEQVTSSKSRFKAGEIIFGKIRPYFHKVGVAFVDGVTSSDSIVVRPVDSTLHGLVLMTVSSDEFVATTAQQMKEGSKMPRADWKQMKAYSVPLPPSGLLSNFDGVIQPIVQQLKSISFANQKLRAARDLLLPRLMSGELAV
jgi:type I restriction enzyme S subunit